VVLAVACALVVIDCGVLALLLSTTRETSHEIGHLLGAIDPPKNHLLDLERDNDSAQRALSAAVVTTSTPRTRLLSLAITYSQRTASEWTKYKSETVGLPGESRLAVKYEKDQAVASKASSDALVPILNSTTVGSLPQAEIDAYSAVSNDLIALHTMYRKANTAGLVKLGERSHHFEVLLFIGGAAGFGLLFAGTVVGLRIAGRTMRERAAKHEAAALAAFETRLRRALELVDSGSATFAVAERAMSEAIPDAHATVLVADSSDARLTPVSDNPTCGVSTPGECPALRSSSVLTFVDSSALDACPLLAANAAERCSATCVPVTIAGHGAAIMHLVGVVGHPPDGKGATDLVARGVGDRVTLLQAMATFQLQATRDPLTGLLNRRSLETAVDRILVSGRSFSVAFGDLDHFKQLNDLHGHEAGDRALREFSRTLTDSLRPEDVICRWGGEEFLIVLPDCDTAMAIEAMDRVRTNLALGSISGHTAGVTVSFGVAHSSDADGFDEVVERADTALREAKDSGRNRVVRFESSPRPAEVLS